MSIADNLAGIQRRMLAAGERAGRAPGTVRLMGVTKTQPAAAVREAVEAGLRLFGESKIQEAKVKIPECPAAAEWHFIGHLQSNKAREAARWFGMVQSVDSLALATELNQRAEQQARELPILLEVNVAGEASKFGYPPDRLLAELEDLNALPRLAIHGLMAIPPHGAHPEKSRPYFQRLAGLRRDCEDRLGAPLPELSMGMSGDFEVAIEEGATLIRVGTALFGARRSLKPAGGADA